MNTEKQTNNKIYPNTCLYIYIYSSARVRVCICVCICVYMCVCECVCLYVCVCVYLSAFKCVYIFFVCVCARKCYYVFGVYSKSFLLLHSHLTGHMTNDFAHPPVLVVSGEQLERDDG